VRQRQTLRTAAVGSMLANGRDSSSSAMTAGVRSRKKRAALLGPNGEATMVPNLEGKVRGLRHTGGGGAGARSSERGRGGTDSLLSCEA
jgi:hypothetical protein